MSASRPLPHICLLSVLALQSCPEPNKFVPPPPPKVGVQTPVVKDLTNFAEFTGNTEGIFRVEIRARVRGFLQEIRFKPGDIVEKDAPLFLIDPRPFKATLAGAEAELASRVADLGLAQTNVDKLESVTSGAVSEIQKIEARAKRDIAIASVQGAKARVTEAQLDLAYTDIKSPIHGRISRNLMDVGNLVGSGASTLLAEVINDEEVYAYFDISEQVLLEAVKARTAKNQARDASIKNTKVFLARMTDLEFPFEGRLDYVDPSLSVATGTLRARALFKNPDYQLFAGLFVKLRIPFNMIEGALLVPTEALGQDQQGNFLLLVKDDGIVERRNVVAGFQRGSLTMIRSGLTKEDKVIVRGIQRARPGGKVVPEALQTN
jgi:RND family efflux transporter MFP subunit